MSARRALRALAPALLAIAGVTACERGGGSGPAWLAAEPRQVDLEIALDTTRARARVIGPEGGTLTATADDGTRFQLTIPRGALVAPERITMIPVREVRGLPLEGSDFATVQLEPSGLRLLQPAMLTIRTERQIPAAEQVAFAYHGMGEDAHLYPLGLDPRRIEMRLQHFSGYGFGRAAPDDPGRLALQRATAVEARMAAQVAELVARARRGELEGTGSDGAALADAVAAIAAQYYDEVLAGLLRTAESDDRMARCAIQRTFAWQRDALLTGTASDGESSVPSALQQRFDQAQRALPRIVENGYTKGYERFRTACKRDHNLLAVQRLMALEREAQLLGLRTEAMKDLNAAIEECMRFEVEFRSVFDAKTKSGASFHDVVATLQTTVPLLPRTPLDSAPLRYVTFTASGNPAADVFGSVRDPLGIIGDAQGTVTAVGTRPGTFVLHALEWQEANPRDSVLVTNCEGEDEKAAQATIDTLLVSFAPGVPLEIVRFTPDNDQVTFGRVIVDMARKLGQSQMTAELEEASKMGPTIIEEQHWAQHWAQAHREQELGGRTARQFDEVGRAYVLKLAQVEPGVWRADTSWTQPPQLGYSLSERSHLTVRHVP